jgi:6-pyruvoyltetrahydropterin/6-carboxytetrahydropterin synthase
MPGVYEVYVQTHFSAAHALAGYRGDCSRLHGHNWIVETYVRCTQLDSIGIGIDFAAIKSAVKEVLAGLDHFNLNDLSAFADKNPTSENIARFLYGRIGQKLNSEHIRVSKVKVCETPGAGAFYWEQE